MFIMNEEARTRGASEPERTRVCVPSMGHGGLDEQVSQHFGRAPAFTIVDVPTGDVRILSNTVEHTHGSGRPVQIIGEAGVNTVICSSLGPGARGRLGQLGIQVYAGADGTVREAIKAWQEGKLHVATDEDVCERHTDSDHTVGSEG